MKSLLFFCLIFWAGTNVFSQNKSQLEKQKKQNLRKIAETHKILQETSGEKKATLGKLTALSEQISSRKNLIRSFEQEVTLLDNEILELDQLTQAIETDFSALRKEYAALIYASAKANNGFNKLLFLFSAESFNQFYVRLNYLQQYTKARKTQKEQLEKIKITLERQRRKRNEKRYEKQLLLSSQDAEHQSLVLLRGEQDEVFKQLSVREQELKAELEDEQKDLDKLEKLIADLIDREIRKAREEAERRENATASTKAAKPEKEPNTLRMSAAEAETAASFTDLRNRMSWPVQSGFVSRHFGNQPHPVLKGVMIPSDGVTIQTNKGETVQAVCGGTVVYVGAIQGIKLITLQHGDYFTVYNKLKSTGVAAGQKVKAREVIGEVLTNRDGITELQFQIWKNSEKLDPETWLQDR
jgi:murein hydrolase activator